MPQNLLVADAGSTKTDWLVRTPDGRETLFHTDGINPVRDARETVSSVISGQLLPQLPVVPDCVFFYGAGCILPFSDTVRTVLAGVFPHALIEVESDLLGAARALCGHDSGIACILGTGSNSCLYDGHRITENVPPLGYILGDEGSGAVLGRTLLGALLKGLLPRELLAAFYERFDLTYAGVIDRIYRQPAANTFLASLVPFLAEHRTHPGIHGLLVESFSLFFSRNIIGYGRRDLPVSLVGSIAYHFSEEIREAAAQNGLQVGIIMQRPIQKMMAFHV